MTALLIHTSGGYIELDEARLGRFTQFGTWQERLDSGEWRFATEEELNEYERKTA